MLGVIINTFSRGNEVDDKIFDRYSGKTILEHTTLNALEAHQVQKVVVVAPVASRGKIAGHGIFQPGLRTSLEGLKRTPLIYYADVSDDMLSSWYFASLKHSLDKIIVLDAEKPFVPPWLINKVSEILHFSHSIVTNAHEEHFKVHGYSFSHIATANDKFEGEHDRSDPFRCLGELFEPIIIDNSEESNTAIQSSEFSFVYNRGQEAVFDYLLSEFAKGADVNELVSDANAEQEKN